MMQTEYDEVLDNAHKRLSKQDALRLKNAIAEVGKSEAGRLLLWYIIFDVCKINEDSMGGEEVVYRHMGRRSAGLQILSEIEQVDISIYLNMIRDNKAKAENDRLLLNKLVKEIQED